MEVKALFKINEKYVVGDDRKIYRLPYTENKRSYKLKALKEYRNGFILSGVFFLKEHIKYTKIEPYTLIEDKELPF